MGKSFHQIYVHYVFSTKKRQPIIHPDYEKKLWSYISGIGKQQGYPVLAAGGMADHLHLLVSISQTVSISKIIQTIKGNSSKWVNDNYYNDTRPFQWQTGYGAFSVSRSGINKVIAYIHNQKKHHQAVTFKEEFLMLLKKHKIEYDERYLWD